jgi:hypothetical protein
MSSLEEIEARRAARKEAQAKQRDEQRVVDLEAVDALEVQFGDSNVRYVDVPYTPGLPTLAAVRCPKPIEIKRYRATVAPDHKAFASKAAEDLGAICLVYPVGDDRDRLLEARPGLLVGLGIEALGMSTGRAQDEGKG